MKNTCEVCGIEFESKKEAKTCSPRCRVTLARKRVTEDPNVTLKSPDVTHDVTFEFYTISKGNGLGRDTDEKSAIRRAKYWYDVPLAAIPVIKQGYPPVPLFETVDGTKPMDGRKYFLWWKNDFKTTEDGTPILLNPFKKGM